MNIIIKPLIAVMLLAPVGTVTAAQPDNAQLRRANLNALRLIEDYESYSTMRNDEAEENFRYIFNNDSTLLFNDLLGLSADDKINIEDYIDMMKSVRGARITIKNVKSGAINDDGNAWLLTVMFDKSIQYNTSCGAIINSEDYYNNTDYSMTAIIEVDKNTYESHIRSLTGSIASHQPRIAPGFAIVQKSDQRDEMVTNYGHKLTFNKFDQAFISQPYTFEFADDDVNMKVIETGDENCRQVAFEYHPTRWRVRPHIDIGLGNPFNTDTPDGIDISSSSMSFGVDFGYIIPSRSKIKIGIFSGLGISTGKIDLRSSSLSYNYNAGGEADMDGDTYVRYYELNNISQSIKLNYINIPIYADIEYRASRRIASYAQLGIKTHINIGSKIDGYTGEIYSYGLYPQYQNIIISHSWLNNFGGSTLTESRQQFNDPLQSFAADIILGIGVRIKLFGPMSLDLGINYNTPLIDCIKTNNSATDLYSGENISAQQAPVSYTVAGGQVINSLLSDYCKIKINPLSLKAGLTFRF